MRGGDNVKIPRLLTACLKRQKRANYVFRKLLATTDLASATPTAVWWWVTEGANVLTCWNHTEPT